MLKTYPVCNVVSELGDVQTQNDHFVIGTSKELEELGVEVLGEFEVRKQVGDEWLCRSFRQLTVSDEELEEAGYTPDDLHESDIADEICKEVNPDNEERFRMIPCDEDYEPEGVTEVEDCGGYYYVFEECVYRFTLDIDMSVSTTKPIINCTRVW